MSKQISSLWVGLTGDVSGLSKSFTAAIAPVQALGTAVTSAGSAIAGMAATAVEMTGIGALLGAAVGAIMAPVKGVQLAAEFEQASVAMETMLGSAAAAQQVLGDLTKFAAETPFQLPELIAASKQLLAFGVSATDVMPTIRALGDVAAGISAPIGDIAAIYGKIASFGRVTSHEIRELAGRGVPIIGELAKQFGVTAGEVQKLVEEGKVGFPQIEKAFAGMTGPGGRFFGMMEKQSQTLGGLWSTLTDNVGLGLMHVTGAFLDAFHIKDALKSLSDGLGSAADFVVGWANTVAPVMYAVDRAWFGAMVAVYDRVAPVVGRVTDVIVNLWTEVAPTVAGALDAIGVAVSAGWQKVVDFTSPILSGLKDAVASNWSSIVDKAADMGSALFGVVQAAWNPISELAAEVWSAAQAAWSVGTAAIGELSAASGVTVTSAWQSVIDGVKSLADGVTLGLNIASYAIKNWQEVATLAGLKTELAFVSFGNEAEYVFTRLIPAAGQWLGNEWRNILTDLANATSRAMTNLSLNVANVFTSLPGLISGAVSFDKIWVPLLDGFKATVHEFPGIADREMSGLEKSLTTSVNAITTHLLGGLGGYLAEQRKAAEAAEKKLKEILTPHKPDPIPAPDITPPKPLALSATIKPDPLGLSIQPELKPLKAVRVGSAEDVWAGLKPADLLPKPPPPPKLTAAAGTDFFGGEKGADAPEWWGAMKLPPLPKMPDPLQPRPAWATEKGFSELGKAKDDYAPKQLQEAERSRAVLDDLLSATRANKLDFAAAGSF